MIESSILKVQKLLTYKIVRYGLIGGVSTFIHFVIASFYIYSIDSSVFQSNMVGFSIAYIFSYTIQSKYVFDHAISLEKSIKYFIVQFGALLLAIIVSNLFETTNSYLKTLIIVILLPIITFLIHSFWTFKKGKT